MRNYKDKKDNGGIMSDKIIYTFPEAIDDNYGNR